MRSRLARFIAGGDAYQGVQLKPCLQYLTDELVGAVADPESGLEWTAVAVAEEDAIL